MHVSHDVLVDVEDTTLQIVGNPQGILDHDITPHPVTIYQLIIKTKIKYFYDLQIHMLLSI
jgi:hypothetical protein